MMWIDAQVINQCQDKVHLVSFVPKDTFIVLGRSNDPSVELNQEVIAKDGTSVLKRLGGGGAVVLYPGCAVISLGLWVKNYYQNDRYFRLINDAVITTLTKRWHGLSGLYQDGISDLVFNGKKIAGTSLFRSRNYLLYQASILVFNDITNISRYLAHPSKEPAYRAGKSHANFLSFLNELDPSISAEGIVKCAEEDLIPTIFSGELEAEIITPPLEQVSYLKEAHAKPSH